MFYGTMWLADGVTPLVCCGVLCYFTLWGKLKYYLGLFLSCSDLGGDISSGYVSVKVVLGLP